MAITGNTGNTQNQAPAPDPFKDDHKEASKTYLEQTKLLITLASSFILAPAVLFKDLAGMYPGPIIFMEVCFILSVLAGYFAVATQSGSQYDGKYDIYRPATMVTSLAQIGLYLIGMVALIFIFVNQTSAKTPSSPKTITKIETLLMKRPDTLNVRIIPNPKKASPKSSVRRFGIIRDTCRCKCCAKN